jgi:hypothetical protein
MPRSGETVHEREEPEKLEYADPDVEDGDQGVRRYYREPPELSQLLAIAIGAFVVLAALVAVGVYLVRRGMGR